MAQHQLSAEKLQQIHDLAAGWGKIVARRAGDTSTSLPQLDFAALEQIAAAAAAGLTRGALDALLEQQAQTLATEQPCPDCGRLCPVAYEDRPLTVQGGGRPLPLHEPVCHCPDCRRDFFPPTAHSASGQPRLQPDGATDDR